MRGVARAAAVVLLVASAVAPAAAVESDSQAPVYVLRSLSPDFLGTFGASAGFLPAHRVVGSRISRTAIHWDETADLDFSAKDAALQPVLDEGIEVVLTLRDVNPAQVLNPLGDPCVDAQGAPTDGPPKDASAWAAYRAWVRAVAAHYSALGVRSFQIGNEVWAFPSKFWCALLPEYESLLLAASEEIRGAAPEARILPAGFASASFANIDDPSTGPGAGFQMLLSNPGAWDELDHHIYHDVFRTDDVAIWLRSTLDVAGLADKTLITTECGGPDNALPDEPRHAEEVIQRPLMALSSGIDRFITFHLKAAATAKPRFRNMSLLADDPGGGLPVPKPSFFSYATFNRFLGLARTLRRVEVGGDPQRTYLVRVDRPSSSIAVAWSWEHGSIALAAEYQGEELFDHFGAPLGTSGPSLSFADDAPVYVRHARLPQVTIPATRLRLRDGSASGRPERRRLRFRSATRGEPPTHAVAPPPRGSAGDPTLAGSSGGGAILTVYDAAGSEEAVSYALPPAGWTALGSAARPRGFRFRDRSPGAPISRVTVKDDLLAVRGGGAAFGYTLDEPSQGRVAVMLRLGTGLVLCAEAPAQAGSGRHDEVDRFDGEPGAPAPASCLELPSFGSPSGAFLDGPANL